MRIKRFNESADYSSYHPISDEDISDIALEMIDAGFSIEIERYFLNSDCTRTKQPLSDKCIPIYDLCFEKQKEGDYSHRIFLQCDPIESKRMSTIFKAMLRKVSS